MITSVLLLAGGAGTRIRHLHPDVPKPLIPIQGCPFLAWILRYWRRHGISRFVVSLGHLAEKAEAYLSAAETDVTTVREAQPLGTGGAIVFSASAVHLGDPFIAANADSLIAADLSRFMTTLEDPGLDGQILGLRVPDTSRYGSLKIDSNGNLTGFYEKQPGAGVINGGVYFLRQSLIRQFPQRVPLSMELHVFPKLIEEGVRIRVAEVSAEFLDIGTPESLAQAEQFLQRNAAVFSA